MTIQSCRSKWTCTFLFFFLLIFSPNIACAEIYWCQGGWGPGSVYQAGSDGSGSMELLVSDISTDLFITTNQSSQEMIWSGYGKIQKSNLDGTNPETIITGTYYYADMAIDYSAEKLYWTAFENPMPSYNNMIQRSNLDGTNIETILTLNNRVQGFDLDSSSGKMYWTMRQDETQHEGYSICRSNLNGTDMEFLVEGLEILDIELDINNGKMYWTDWVAGTISRSNLNGTNVEQLYAGLKCPYGIDLDGSGKMYWTEWDGYNYNTGQILRADIDGTDVETLYTTTERPSGILVTPEPASICLLSLGIIFVKRQTRPNHYQGGNFLV